MKQLTLSINTDKLFEDLCTTEVLRSAFNEVRKNKGAPGIDRVSIKRFQANLNEELAQLVEELTSWCYRPSPVKRVEIAKATGGVRKLGIPCVRDRVVQTGIKCLLEPYLENVFSESSYGFRPGRSQQQAVKAAKEIVATGKRYVVDIDLSNFFDRVNHDRLIGRLGGIIQDKRILRLIGMTLRSGIMVGDEYHASLEGTTQGSPLSPMLSNLVLDELDKELERRGLSYCRYADDCNLYVGSRKAAERVMEKISQYIEKRLQLVINREKSQVTTADKVSFLGFSIVNATISISKKSLNRAMQMVKVLTPRGTSEKIEQTIVRINRWYLGWSGYYGLTQYPSQLAKIEAHVRRRLRSRIIAQQKRRRHLFRKLIQRGVSLGRARRAVYSNRGRWALSINWALHIAYPVEWFTTTLGQKIVSTESRSHWFDLSLWIKLL